MALTEKDNSLNWFYHVFNESPMVIYLKQPWQFPDILECSGPTACLIGFLNNQAGNHEECVAWVRKRRQKYGSHYYEILCDTQSLTDWFRSQGLDASFVNENSFHDENEFKIMPCAKEYDAIYIAASAAYKNLWMLKETTHKCLWLSGRVVDNNIHEATKAYKNVVTPKALRLSRPETVEAINASRAGLCLSRHEASMRASCEYALCGLPVVNVQTEGGRHSPESCGREVLLDPSFVVPVKEMTCAGLDRAIGEAAAGKYWPKSIRQCYLEKRKPHRARFVEALNRCARHLKIKESFDQTNSFVKHCNFEWQSVVRLLGKEGR